MREIKKYVRFYIPIRSHWSDKRPETPRPVVFFFNYDGKRINSNTGVRIAPCNWDKKKQRVKLGVRRSGEVNRYLDLLEQKINDIYYGGLSEDVEITSTYIFERLKKKKEPIKSFWDYYSDFLETQKMVVKKSSYKTLVTSCNKFKEFCKTEGKVNIRFEDIDPGLLAHYTDFLLRKGNTNNTIHSQLKRLRRFMTHCKKLHLHKNDVYQEYNVPEKTSVVKFLEWSEVKQLMAVQLDSPTEQRSRDLLLFACFTGMRYSDIKQLRKTDIKEHRFDGIETVFHAAHIRQAKTSKDTIVPLLPEAVTILKQYENDPGEFALPQMFLQKVNDALKEVGKKANLNSLQKIEIYKGSVTETKYVEKWKVLSTHVGRRTFVTISATKGLPINVVASITGQNPATTMKHYLGVVNSDKFTELTSKLKFD